MFSKTDKDIRNERIQRAVPEEKYRKPSPVGSHKWDEENFMNFTGTQRGNEIKLHTYRCKTPNDQVKSVTVFFHGLNEHMGLYSHIAQAVSKQGNSVAVGLDFRGFGKSEGLRGWLESVDQLIGDCSRFIILTRALYPNVPIFTLGQSMGGLASYLMGLNDLCDGSILITPAIMDNYYNQPCMKRLGLIFGACFPTWSPFPPVHVAGSKNPQILETNLKDPQVVQVAVLPGTGRVLVQQMRACPQTFQRFTKPFLVISAGMDQIVDPDVGDELMKASPSKDKQILHYDNMWHDCVQEEEIIEIIPKIVAWIVERSKK